MKKFIGVYYEWVHDYKVLEEKITMKKDVKKLVDGYNKYTGRGVKVQKTPGSTGMTLCKIKLKEPTDIENYRSFVGQIMWYTMKVGPDMANTERELDVHMSNPGP